ncbi:hypothetical protein AVEN_64158-1 [Araneus ventricosus]|uniref:Uncharacterized protein n=1 Tax=Araneus ventricosus TaxID=182803 RepID=A0A4Y2WKS4_ARAVE|nr:hypothetical protein AVEN_256456-1 [Araneus ventricosus]GBO37298.1 hypothetical protein AVEN_64158-1 [Araneus ventricosus]
MQIVLEGLRWLSGKISASEPEAPGSKPDSNKNPPVHGACNTPNPTHWPSALRWCGAEPWRGAPSPPSTRSSKLPDPFPNSSRIATKRDVIITIQIN